MMKSVPLASALLATVLTAAADAQGPYKDVEYLAGHEGYPKKLEGHLVPTDSAVLFTKRDGKDTPLFAIPYRVVTGVSSSSDRADASVGSKIMFGFLARSHKDEFVQLTTETPATAEGVVFKVRRNESAGIVAKIRYRMKALRGPGGATQRRAGATGQGAGRPSGATEPPRPSLRPAAPDSSATGVPPGIAYVGDRLTRRYYPAECSTLKDVPKPDRMYYRTESAAQADGYRPSAEC